MATVEVFLPGSLTPDTTVSLPQSLACTAPGNDYIFDLSRLNWVEPFGMLFCAAALRRFMRERPGSTFRASGHSNNSYAAHMGFYTSFGLAFGNQPGEARGSHTYIPISRVTTKDLYAELGYAPLADALRAKAARLAWVLLQTDLGPLFETVVYSLAEILRNVLEHSRARELWYAAQYWRSLKRVELAILDEGIGIRQSLARNERYRVTRDYEALKLAVQCGVSGAAPQTIAEKYHAMYGAENQGYGLYVTHELCQHERGEFWICSGTGALYRGLLRGGASDTDFSGTAIRMQLNTDAVRDLSEFINSVVPAEVVAERRPSTSAGRRSGSL